MAGKPIELQKFGSFVKLLLVQIFPSKTLDELSIKLLRNILHGS